MSNNPSLLATVAPTSPLVFDMNHDFHIFKFAFALEALLTEDAVNETFDLSIKYKKGGDVKTIIDRKFHIDINQTFAVPDVPATLHFSLTGAAIKDGHAAVRLQISVTLHVLLSHTFNIIDQILTTAMMTSAQVLALRSSSSGAISPKWLKDEDQYVMIGIPAPSIITTSVGGTNAESFFTTS